jgi:hypothetical protein
MRNDTPRAPSPRGCGFLGFDQPQDRKPFMHPPQHEIDAQVQVALETIMRHGCTTTAVVGLSTTPSGHSSLGFHFDEGRSIGEAFAFEDGTTFEVLALVPADQSVVPAPAQLEVAEALGFDSVASMKTHQVWLAQMQAHRERCRQAVKESETTGVIDCAPSFYSQRGTPSDTS